MGLIDFSKLNDVDDRPCEDVPVPEWGGDVRLRVMSAHERDQLAERASLNGKVDSSDFRAFVLVRCIVDENGERVFDNKQLMELSKKNTVVIDRLFNKALVMNGMNQEGVESLLGKVEGASITTRLNGSGSA